ncbi:MAG: endopeptidase La [Deltaproteobacteria bacterium]|uniref:Lon protease n=1 Tax=Candidatus Zymogenus saltonus TaxID=2844893 RepID=A0A9D8KCP8_9DELT|nr:endopeptidase La [Candidatus Zymogenus saltonus]
MFFKNDKDDETFEMGDNILPLLPLRDIIIFPHMVVPLFVGRKKSINALETAMASDKSIILSAQLNAKMDDPTPDQIYRIGTVGSIIQLLRLPDGTVKVLVEGKQRAKVKSYIPNEDFFLVDVEYIKENDFVTPEIEALIRSINSTFETYAKLNKKIPPEMIMSVASITEPSRLADTIVTHLNLKLEEKQQVLEIEDPSKRLEKVYSYMQSEIEILQIERRIKNRVKKQMERTQKEYYLNEQMRAIQKELGEKDEFKAEVKEIEDKIKKKKLSSEALERADKEVKKLKMMSPMSAEATVIRNYLDWILALPWNEYTEDKLDIDEATRILDEDHYGLKKPKERILEYLAVKQLKNDMKGPILCLVGPPGVGKTSLGRSIARATGRNFVRLSLGGVRDEAEIRGHRRTYIGALPGKIIQYLKKSKSSNPVYLMDEVDKMSTDFRGDPSAALLEVLDPEQNFTFNDHYLDLDYDLSKVMFITTANVLHNIPKPLQDRMEIIQIDSYTEIEKLHIAQQFLVKKQRNENGLEEKNVTFTDKSMLEVIRKYTRESGVRNLEREIGSICRKVAKDVVRYGREYSVKVTPAKVRKYLGIPRYRYGKVEEEDRIGIATGMAWTEVGGELLTIEVTVVPGKGKLTITGKLGEVMQESAQAAMSYIRGRAEELGLDRGFYQNVDLHIHVPEGAIPKDGPSAGITIATAIASALAKLKVRRDIAMTGEITLRGRVLPIGGLKEKLLAANRGGIKEVIIPRENEKDLEDIPDKIKKSLKITLADHMDSVISKALAIANHEEFFRKNKEEKEREFLKEKEQRQSDPQWQSAH